MNSRNSLSLLRSSISCGVRAPRR